MARHSTGELVQHVCYEGYILKLAVRFYRTATKLKDSLLTVGKDSARITVRMELKTGKRPPLSTVRNNMHKQKQ